jgi:hypothetical protein
MAIVNKVVSNIIKKIEADREKLSAKSVTSSQHELTTAQLLSIAEWLTKTFSSFSVNVNNSVVILTISF